MAAKKGVRRTFPKPEIMIKMKCDVHPGEVVWLGVVDHPFFAVTDTKGAFEVKGLPPGRYTIEAWHERYASTEIEVTVKAGGKASLELTFTKKK